MNKLLLETSVKYQKRKRPFVWSSNNLDNIAKMILHTVCKHQAVRVHFVDDLMTESVDDSQSSY